MSFAELSEQWEKSRNELKVFLDSIPEKHARRKFFKHPIAGMFNAAQGMVFLREHLIHHVPQIQRYL
jgi:hypothetical protein